jgi:hypothetical protein
MSSLCLLLFLVWTVVFAVYIAGMRRLPRRLQLWADRNSLTIVGRTEPLFAWKGPFAERTAAQNLYRVVFEDAKGQRRSAWVLCGHPLLGSWADRVEVRWDHDQDDHESKFPSACEVLSPADRRLLAETMRASVVRCLLLGVGVGAGIAVVALVVTGLARSYAAVPMMVIGIMLGAIVGGLFGIVLGVLVYRARQGIKSKALIDEI